MNKVHLTPVQFYCSSIHTRVGVSFSLFIEGSDLKTADLSVGDIFSEKAQASPEGAAPLLGFLPPHSQETERRVPRGASPPGPPAGKRAGGSWPGCPPSCHLAHGKHVPHGRLAAGSPGGRSVGELQAAWLQQGPGRPPWQGSRLMRHLLHSHRGAEGNPGGHGLQLLVHSLSFLGRRGGS